MEGRRKIVIVGGGIIGCTTAYYLTRHPDFDPALHSIILLEAAPSVATGASGKAGGLLALWAYPPCLVPLSYRLHAQLAAEHDGARKWGYRKLGCGKVDAVVSKERIAEMQKHRDEDKVWERLPKKDQVAEKLLHESSLPSNLDWIESDTIVSWAEMGEQGSSETAQVHPLHFTTSICNLACEAGLDLRTQAKVTRLLTSRDGVEAVEYLDRESKQLHQLKDVTDVVLAAGPWTGRLLPRSKVEGLRAHSVVYEADLSPYAVFTDIQLPANYVPEHRSRLGQKRVHQQLVDPEIYARPFGEAYACGEPDTSVPLPETADEVECDEAQCDDLVAYIGTVSPVLAAAPVKTKQACYLPRHMRSGQESGPLIGKTGVPGLWVAAGHTCWGIQNGPGTGKLMSEYILEGAAKSANVARLDPRRYKV